MSVLIKGMEKPEHCGYCRFRYDGICHALQKTQYSMNECPLVVIDDAGLDDTISRQAAIATAISGRVRTLPTTEDGENWIRVNEVRDSLLSLPSAERHGRWIDRWFCSNYSGYDYGMTCSVCGKPTHRQFAEKMPPFCPNCGAKMEEGGNIYE